MCVFVHGLQTYARVKIRSRLLGSLFWALFLVAAIALLAMIVIWK
jgi:hypothetical protein